MDLITGIIPIVLIISVILFFVFRSKKKDKVERTVNLNDTNTKGKILPKYCHNCGKEIDMVDRESMFCKYCGVDLSKIFTNIDSKERPVGVSIIAWIIIILEGIAGLICFGLLVSGEHLSGLSSGVITWGLFSCIIEVALAIGILKGKNWCRITYLIYYPIVVFISCIIGVTNTPFVVLIFIVCYIVSVIILTRPNASKFFKSS